MVSEGKDPRHIKAEAKRKRHEEGQNTFEGCTADFLEKYAQRRLRPSTQREYRRILTGQDTRHWHDKPIAQLTKRDVLDVLEAIDRRGSPGAAKRALVYLRRFFNWCAERDILSAVPTDRIRPLHPEVKRDRVLSEEELRHVLGAIDAEASLFGPLIRVLLLTGQRRSEVAGMRWSELRSLNGADMVWEIPGERTKNRQSHLVPLVPAVCKIIRGMPRIGDLVFTTTGKTPVSGFGRAKERLDARIATMRGAEGIAPIRAWTLHDLRRTMVTVMNEQLGVAPHVVEAVVNHMSGLAKAGVAGVYNRALYMEDRRAALGDWSKYADRLRASRRRSRLPV